VLPDDPPVVLETARILGSTDVPSGTISASTLTACFSRRKQLGLSQICIITLREFDLPGLVSPATVIARR